MPLVEFKRRNPENVAGKYYVSDQCLDCDLCRETAPANFARYDAGGYSYVCKQPENAEEEALVRDATAGCCMSTIHADGETFDWQSIPADTPFYLTPKGKEFAGQHAHSCCKHQSNIYTRLWQRFFGKGRHG